MYGVTEAFAVGGLDVAAVHPVVVGGGIETIRQQSGMPRSNMSRFFHEHEHGSPWVLAAFCYSQKGH